MPLAVDSTDGEHEDDIGEYIGTTTGKAFVDSTAPVDVPLYYRVNAFDCYGDCNEGDPLPQDPELAVMNEAHVSELSVAASTTVRSVSAAAVDTDQGGRIRAAVWPNPFRSAVSIRFTLGRPGMVRLGVFDIAGRRVVSRERWRAAGVHDERWDAVDETGGRVAPGVYFVKVWVDGQAWESQKLVMVR